MAGEEVEDPGEALVETTQERGQGEPYAKRVTTDGDVLEHSATNVWFDGAEWHFDPQPLAWRRVVRLEPGELDEVREAIVSSGFMDAAPEHRPSGTSIGGTNVTWTASHEGRTHTVRLFGVPDASDAGVEALAAAVERAIAGALNRSADG